MRLGIAGAVTAVVFLLALGEASAQNSGGVVSGMFGPRTLGGTLQPQPRTAVNGIVTAPSGMFVGRGRATGTTFNPSVWQSSVAQQQQAAANFRQAEADQQFAQQQQLGFREAAPSGVPPEQWFRAPAINPGGINPGGVMNQAPVNQGAGNTVPAGMVPYIAERTVILPVVAGFAAPEPAGSPATRVAMLIQRTPRITKLSPISVTEENDATVLRGVVRSTQDRQMAEDMARMEPGVWEVRNELLVTSPPISALPVALPR